MAQDRENARPKLERSCLALLQRAISFFKNDGNLCFDNVLGQSGFPREILASIA
jgi:hypothetical protein